MENENANVTNVQGNDLSALKNLFADYEKKQTQSKRRTKEEMLAKYFTPRKTKETFRILPPKHGRKYVEEAYFHAVTANIAGGKKKNGVVIYCPAHNDPKIKKLDAEGRPALDSSGNQIYINPPCPLCAKYKKLISKQDQSIRGKKKESMTADELKIKAKNDEIFRSASEWEARKYFIVKGVDRGIEKDGVKFWRFKDNYKKQGVLDKLLPVVRDYMENNEADFTDPNNGTDLNIIMVESEANKRKYMAVSAITCKGKSKLHADPFIEKEWLNDDITWRDVYQPKKAPNVTPYEFLEMVANGTNPYWDDSDANNKHWVFPNRPDLEELANTRKRNLDADDDNEDDNRASDLTDDEYPQVTISNITEEKVGKFTDNAVDVGDEIMGSEPETTASNKQEWDDLPF